MSVCAPDSVAPGAPDCCMSHVLGSFLHPAPPPETVAFFRVPDFRTLIGIPLGFPHHMGRKTSLFMSRQARQILSRQARQIPSRQARQILSRQAIQISARFSCRATSVFRRARVELLKVVVVRFQVDVHVAALDVRGAPRRHSVDRRGPRGAGTTTSTPKFRRPKRCYA